MSLLVRFVLRSLIEDLVGVQIHIFDPDPPCAMVVVCYISYVWTSLGEEMQSHLMYISDGRSAIME